MKYTVGRADGSEELNGNWAGPRWGTVESLSVNNFRPEGSDHRPDVQAKLAYNGRGIFGIFNVKDRYVRSVKTKFNEGVCSDSCVEFFVRPTPDVGPYCNFEFNCGGTMLASHVTGWKREDGGSFKCRMFSDEMGDKVKVFHSMPAVVDPEIRGPVEWILEFFIPFEVFAANGYDIDNIEGGTWRANLYKCADATSHRHWASWSPVRELNFHAPETFGTLYFAC